MGQCLRWETFGRFEYIYGRMKGCGEFDRATVRDELGPHSALSELLSRAQLRRGTSWALGTTKWAGQSNGRDRPNQMTWTRSAHHCAQLDLLDKSNSGLKRKFCTRWYRTGKLLETHKHSPCMVFQPNLSCNIATLINVFWPKLLKWQYFVTQCYITQNYGHGRVWVV